MSFSYSYTYSITINIILCYAFKSSNFIKYILNSDGSEGAIMLISQSPIRYVYFMKTLFDNVEKPVVNLYKRKINEVFQICQ